MNRKNILAIILCGLSFYVQAQSYNLSTTTGVYTNLTNSTSLNGTAPWDDPEFEIPIGFDFEYFDTTINQIYIDNWGFGAELTPDPNETGTLPILTPYGADIADRAYDESNPSATTGSLSNISYLLEGNVGSRILKIEWRNVGFLSDIVTNGVSSDFTNFQLWLYEGSNDIEIHFGPNSISNPNESFDGETGTSVALIPAYNFGNDTLVEDATFLTGNPSNPTVIQSSVNDSNFLNGVVPNGTIYKFTLSTLSTEEFQPSTKFVLFTPAKDILQLSGLNENKAYEIYDMIGKKIQKGWINSNQDINIQSYAKGTYFIKFIDNNQTIRFIKS